MLNSYIYIHTILYTPIVLCRPASPQVAHNKRAQMQQLVFARTPLRARVSNIKLYAENTGAVLIASQ